MSSEKLLSQTINITRFPMIVAVIFIHSTFLDVVINGVKQVEPSQYPLYYNVQYIGSQIIARIAVPLFYFVSGFLFFYKTNGFSIKIYINKLQKRVKTLVIPYIFWNFVALLSFLILQIFFTQFISGKNKLIDNYSLFDWFWVFWDKSKIVQSDGCVPINPPLWFLRDLICTVIFTPIIYIFVKYLRIIPVIILGLLWVNGTSFVYVGLSSPAFFFFTFGAYFSIMKKNFVSYFSQISTFSQYIYVIMIAIEMLFLGQEWIEYFHNITVFCGVITTIGITARLILKNKIKENKILTNASFFIYAYHAMFLSLLIKVSFKLIQPQSNVELIILYLLCPAITAIFGLVIYKITKQILPSFTALITGGR